MENTANIGEYIYSTNKFFYSVLLCTFAVMKRNTTKKKGVGRPKVAIDKRQKFRSVSIWQETFEVIMDQCESQQIGTAQFIQNLITDFTAKNNSQKIYQS